MHAIDDQANDFPLPEFPEDPPPTKEFVEQSLWVLREQIDTHTGEGKRGDYADGWLGTIAHHVADTFPEGRAWCMEVGQTIQAETGRSGFSPFKVNGPEVVRLYAILKDYYAGRFPDCKWYADRENDDAYWLNRLNNSGDGGKCYSRNPVICAAWGEKFSC